MNAPLLSALREPPKKGRYYMVPVIEDYPWLGRRQDWPVLGPAHSDKEFFDFATVHYHVDIRFIRHSEAVRAADYVWSRATGDLETDAALCATGAPLASLGADLPRGRPVLRRRRCRVATIANTLESHHLKAVAAMHQRYGNPAEPLRQRDGRLLCPHRKVDLSQFPPNADGIVVCPLHGLRVRCSA